MSGNKKNNQVSKAKVMLLVIGVLGTILLFGNLAIIRSESIDKIFCVLGPVSDLKKGDAVFFMDDRIKPNVVIAKYVGCMPKEWVRISKEASYCDGVVMTKGYHIKKQNSVTIGEYRLKVNELFLYGNHKDSFDSRYVGPIDKNQLIKKGLLCF